jgi:hypothetical protein
MKINELISEQSDIDEGLGSFLGKAAGHAVGGVGAAWRDAKQGYKDAKAVWDPKDPPGTYNNDPAATPPESPAPAPTAPAAGGAPAPQQQAPAPTGDTGRPYVAPAPAGGAPAPAPAADPGAIGSIMQAVDKLDPASKKQLAGELEKSMAAPPPAAETPPAPGATPPAPGATPPADSGQDHGLGKQSDGKFITPGQQFDTETGKPLAAPGSTPAPAPTGQGVEIDPAKAAADKAAKNQADADQRNADIEKTKQANAAKNQQDAAIKAAADAARAKSGFQQTAADKLAIQAADKAGIREAEEKKKKLKKKKVVTEFKSNFLGMII